MKDIIALAIPSLSLFVYILLASIEFGASLFSVFPSLLSEESTVRDYMNPLWETTSIFLAFSLISLFSFFPGATSVWALDLLPILFSFLAVMGVRIACILLTQYGDSRSLIVRMLYFLASFSSALLGMLILMYFLTGSWHLPNAIFLWTALLALFAILFAGSSFFRAYENNVKLTQLARFSGTLFFLSATFFVLSMFRTYIYFFLQSHRAGDISIVLILCLVGALIAEIKSLYWTSFAMYSAALAALFSGFFIVHLPFIVFPSVTIAGAVTNDASFKVLEASFGIGIILIIPALILLYKLFMFKKSKEGAR